MLQPRSTAVFFLIAIVVNTITGDQNINSSPRKRRQDGDDVTTVLLVDSHGRSTFGRFLSVKPDLGLLTSTARTFIQEGVTTEYATQVLGTTLDNGRLYAHLLTKSSRVLYDNDQPTRTHQSPGKKWNLDNYSIGKANFVKNTDYISPSQANGPFIVFPTTKPEQYSFEKNHIAPHKETSDEELLSEPSNNPRVPFAQDAKKESVVFSSQNNVKVFQINPQLRNIDLPSYKEESEENNVIRKDEIGVSKVKEWDNLPTFTVRNEFSPSGFSYLGDLPDFDINTERTKQTTAAERRAKLLFRGGIPNKQDLKTVTYTGFADFTTTVGDTVIVFTPQTEAPKPATGHATKLPGEATIQPTRSLNEPNVQTKLKTFLNHEPGVTTETVAGHKITMQTTLPTMVIDAFNRKPKNEDMEDDEEEEHEDVDAKSAVLAREQQATPALPTIEKIETTNLNTMLFSSESIEPSESQIAMLSTPSDEDIAKIFASLQAKAAQQATEPLNTPSTIFLDETTPSTNSFAGATTIFFEDELQSATLLPETTPKPETQESDAHEEQQEEPNTTQEEAEQEEEVQTTEHDEILEKQTTENVFTTTFKEIPTTNEVEEEEITTVKLPETTTQEEQQEETDVKCTGQQQIVPTTEYKTLTYLTTFFIPIDDDTSTSVRANEVISTEIGFQTRPCDFQPTPTESTIQPTAETTYQQVEEEETTEPMTQPLETTELQPTTEQLTTFEQHVTTTEQLETTPMEITTERRHVTESEPETAEITTESGEEIELLFKTLYTTYTYLTTYFQDSTSSVASRKEVITNIVTSTIDPKAEMSDEAIAGLISKDFKSKPVTFEDFDEIAPSGVGVGRPTSQPSLGQNDNQPDNIFNSAYATPALNKDQVAQTINAIKTYYTTYTYFTTIFVDGETEISSRTEVYTNYVTPTLNENIAPTAVTLDDEIKSKIIALNEAADGSNSSKTDTIEDDNIDNNIVISQSSSSGPKYQTLERTTTESSENDLLDLSEYETISTMVTDVRSSTSEGDKRIIDNVDKRNVLLDDQIVSESNNESEIIPSPTLLLQTSYTTFTYFTTMYQGTTSSNVVSRLDTVTNIVTETLTPTPSLTPDDINVPITHYTTFTYWTTYYKDGTTKVTNREETVTNIDPIQAFTVPPTMSIAPTSVVESGITQTALPELEASKDSEFESITTVYTTFTYYTTAYDGNKTILNSRLETQSHILNKSDDIESNQIARAIGAAVANTIDDGEKKIAPTEASLKPTGLLSTVKSTVENNGTQTIFATDVYGTYIDGLYAKVLESSSSVVTPTVAPSATQENLKPTGVVSINQGKIVDADGISTLFYTTQAVGTYIDNLYAQVIESTSSLQVDEVKKGLLTETPPAHRTGLVRLIEGSIVHSHTTTVYQSKVLGTVIEGRYAQIIESTSSFIVEEIKPTVASDVNIQPTPTQAPGAIDSTDLPISPSPVVIQGSISDSSKVDEESTTDDEIEDEESSTEDGDGNSSVKSRLTYQSRKRTFTPVIRPFASRSKPTFAPKRKGPKSSSATTITRSDFTPTVTAIPATKSGNRFGGGRKSSTASVINPSASGSRRFSRPRSSSAGGGGASSSFSPSRGRSSGRIQPTASSFGSSSRRGGGFRSSSTAPARLSSAYNGNNRFRIRPTLASPLNRSPNSNAVTLPSTVSDDENDLTTLITDNPENNEDESTAPTTTVNGRSSNPLLKFRRPPISRPPTTPRTAAKSGNRNGKTTKPLTTTPKPARGFYARPNAIPNRVRNNNALFPRRNLFTTTTPSPSQDEEEEDLEDSDDPEIEEGDDEDTEYEGSNTNTQTENPPVAQDRKGRAYSPVQIRPFGLLRRSKRQTAYSRFRRPSHLRTTTAEPKEEPTTAAAKPTTKGRFVPRNNRNRNDSKERKERPTSAPARISPSRPNLSHGRSQFTLRDSGSSGSRSSFKRPSTSSSSSGIRKPTPRPSRLRPSADRAISKNTNENTEKEPSRKTSRTRSKSPRRGSTSRSKPNNDIDKDVNYVVPGSDGTITVTHQIPTEVTIPVVNGKVTEYKNIITAQLRTEVLGPKQYSTTLNPAGKDITILVSESTGIGANGATQITKYTLNETPTTTVIFTPTYIRGRKTSFSHVIPSTVYVVEPVVKTIAPALSPQAPLANILLSQLLLGNPIQQQNPLLALQNPAVPAAPTTEFKTRTTTYVTTVTAETSTVIPLTFRGKEILTTIIDSSVNVITATEFITDTVIVTPTPVLQANNQLNSLLVQQLLQQQQQQAINPLFQQPAGVLNTNEDLFKKSLFDDNQNLADDSEEYQIVDDVTEPPRRKSSRKKPKKPAPTPAEPVQETSVITLYVSGRTPGEFSTVLSTVVVGEDNKRKREAIYVVEPSRTYDDLVISTLDYVDSYVMPATEEIHLENSEINSETQSLESILGNVSKQTVTESPYTHAVKPTKVGGSHSKKYKVKYEKAVIGTNKDSENKSRALDEARYNLATRIMSNGVEVIVAGDKSTLPGEPDVKRILPSSIYKPVTLKPSTLTNNMMMALPQDIESLSSSLYPNQFVTKTCLTTFTYMTTYLENGTTAISSHEQVVSNIATEERNTGKILPTPTMGITLTQYPNLAKETFMTTYTYLNTILDGEQPLVVTSKRVVTNTVTAPDDYLSLFHPDQKALAVKDTNTYYSTIALEKTLYEGKVSKVISTNEVVTQVVITESIPPKGTSVMTSYIALDMEEKEAPSKEYSTTDVQKTYFVTYTYYNTEVHGENTIVHTNVSTSSDVVTEKLFIPQKKTKGSTKSVINTSPIKLEKESKKKKLDIDYSNFNIFATKTYLTTFTYYTTLLQEQNNSTATVISSHSKVIENVETETIDASLFDKKYLNSIKKEIRESGSSVTKFATLNDGQKIEITAVAKEKIKPTKVLPIEKTQMPEVQISTPAIESSKPNVVTGSTIIFVDEFDDPFAPATKKTPSLSTINKTQSKNALNSLLSSEIVKERPSASKKKNHKHKTTAAPSKTATSPKTPEKIKPNSPVSNLLGSINIQALKPVLNAMAGLIQTNLKARKNESLTTTPKPAEKEPQDVQNRSPIYIPVGGLTDIETAESENIAQVWRDEHIIENVPKHESLILHGGIPISPGEIITTNSDVIVGKPGRVGPRIPAIPLRHPDLATAQPQQIPLGMKPPPVQNKVWPKRHSEHYNHPAVIHAPNKDDYVGPPPPQKTPIRAQNAVRGEKHSLLHNNDHRRIPINFNHEHESYNQFALKPNHDSNFIITDNQPIISAETSFSLASSIISEQIVLPEIIERSTGQPLLVNIQPSQVAFVNIPHNRTTALIYGGSTEPHYNGQYFDDPSPYPEPEFSAIESFSNGLPKFASTYSEGDNQKQVGGVIKVANYPININPPSIPVAVDNLDINPSKASNLNLVNGVVVNSYINNHDISMQVPPISFGMVQQGHEINAHIIHHENEQFGNRQQNKVPYPFGNFNKTIGESQFRPETFNAYAGGVRKPESEIVFHNQGNRPQRIPIGGDFAGNNGVKIADITPDLKPPPQNQNHRPLNEHQLAENQIPLDNQKQSTNHHEKPADSHRNQRPSIEVNQVPHKRPTFNHQRPNNKKRPIENTHQRPFVFERHETYPSTTTKYQINVRPNHQRPSVDPNYQNAVSSRPDHQRPRPQEPIRPHLEIELPHIETFQQTQVKYPHVEHGTYLQQQKPPAEHATYAQHGEHLQKQQHETFLLNQKQQQQQQQETYLQKQKQQQDAYLQNQKQQEVISQNQKQHQKQQEVILQKQQQQNQKQQETFAQNQKQHETYLQIQKQQETYAQNQKQQETYLQNQKQQETYLQNQKQQETYLQNQKQQETYLHNQKQQETYLQNQKQQETYLQNQKQQETYLQNQKQQETYLQNQKQQQETYLQNQKQQQEAYLQKQKQQQQETYSQTQKQHQEVYLQNQKLPEIYVQNQKVQENYLNNQKISVDRGTYLQEQKLQPPIEHGTYAHNQKTSIELGTYLPNKKPSVEHGTHHGHGSYSESKPHVDQGTYLQHPKPLSNQNSRPNGDVQKPRPNLHLQIQPPVEYQRPPVDYGRPSYGRPHARPRPNYETSYKDIVGVMNPPPLYSGYPVNTLPTQAFGSYESVNVSSNTIRDQSYDDDDEDLVNDAGEVIQESNSRPLVAPIEILNRTSTEATTSKANMNYIPHENEVLSYIPHIKQPRPFVNPVVRPENHQTNQINHKETNVIVQSGSPNVFANAFDRAQTTTHKIPSRFTTTRRARPAVTRQRTTVRPKVTSLPLDSRRVTSRKPVEVVTKQTGSQTEEPFNAFNKPNTGVYNFGTQDIPKSTTTKRTRTTSKPLTTLYLNKGEVDMKVFNYTKPPVLEDMEIMKPPPVGVIDLTVKPPEVNLIPPTSESPSSEKPYKVNYDEVYGMTPPRPVSQKPVYSMEIDIADYTTKRTTEATTQETTTRRVATRRPTRRTTTVPSSTTTTRRPVYWQRPVTPISYYDLHRNRTTTTTRRPETTTREEFSSSSDIITESTQETTTRRKYVEDQAIAQSETVKPVEITTEERVVKTSSNAPETTTEAKRKLKPDLSVLDMDDSEEVTRVNILGSESYEDLFKPTEMLQDTPILPTGTVETVELELPGKIKPTRINYYTQRYEGTPQHLGNGVKVFDDGTTTHKRRVVTSVFKRPLHKESKLNLPTRYVTHTKTSTVTITKTTVVKSLGAPPSTMTILITKTEKLTIVDTVTEFHTLLKPTTIAETVIVDRTSSLYPPGSTYGHYPIHPTHVHASEIEPTIVIEGDSDEDLDEFIIGDEDPIDNDLEDTAHHDNDSFFVVMTDENKGSIVKIPPKAGKEESHETQHRDEMLNSNEVNRVLLGGILIASPPSLETKLVSDRCHPECKAARNELCQKSDGVMRCVCRPGFARMFPDRPCKPTYTYTMRIALDRHGKDRLRYEDSLSDTTTPEFAKLASATHDGLDRMVMQSDLRDVYHGVHVQGYEPVGDVNEGIVNTFNLQLSDNIDETRLKEVFQKYLRNNNYSLGGTELYASKEILSRLEADDFDECADLLYHDCSEYAHCFNLRGTYTCSCKEGFADLSENILYPGRICSSELVGCEKCHYHGTCYSRGDDQVLCECFQWYAGESCQVNLKVLLIALVTLGVIMFTLLLICIVITCARRKPESHSAHGMSFLPQRVPVGRGGTLDRRAMIQDTSSESGQSDNNTLPYVPKKNKKQLKGALKKTKSGADLEQGGSATLTYAEQKDRSLTVMIPRAKYHPAPPTSPHNMTSFEKRKNSVASSNEAKLLSYLDAGPSPNKVDQRKYSKTSESYRDGPGSRKTSGALVSAGFEVSATVGVNNMGTLGTIATTCGTEADRSENATLIQKISADLLSSTGTQSQFNTLRKSITDAEDDALENWLDITPRIQTISESRSYDETTIQPPMKSFRNDYDSKSSQHPHDEANTMAERDLGSTFLLPHTHLYKPDRGSDISGFESL